MNTRGLRLLQIAAVYLVVGALMGGFMGVTLQFYLAPVHAHLLLLGWASLALAGLVYHLYPGASDTRLARVHFRLHNLALPIFAVGLGLMLTGHEWAHFILGPSAGMLIGALTTFALNILLNVKPAAA